MNKPIEKPTKKCQVENCEQKVVCRGYCRPHYNKFLRGTIGEKTIINRNLRHSAFSSVTPASSYFLGILYTDGYIYTGKEKNDGWKHNNISLVLTDKDVVEKFCDFLNIPRSVIKQRKYASSTKETYYLYFTSEQIVKDVTKYGIVQQKTYIPCSYPQDVYDSHYFRGLIDGDGSIKRNRITLVGNVEFLESLRDYMFNHYGFRFSLWVSTHKKTGYNLGHLNFLGNKSRAKEFLEWIYQDAEYYMKRKLDMAINRYSVEAKLADNS